MNTPKEKNNQALIAIVDDDQSFREALESLLALIGFRTATFASARDFLDSPQFPNVSCAILDVSMPGMDGLELQRQLVATHPIPDHLHHGSPGRKDTRAGGSGGSD